MKTLFDEYGALVIVCISGMIILNIFCNVVFGSYFDGVKELIRYEEIVEVD